MDFKDKNPNISYWHFGGKTLARKVCPYDGPNYISIEEIVSPLDQTVFLSLFGDWAENENFDLSVIYYLIEAPRDCKMRQAFEVGDITFEDYWYHKGWLIEAKIPSLAAQGYNLRYIHPSNMCQAAKEYLQDPYQESPVQRKYDYLISQKKRSFSKADQAMLEELERKYACILKIA